MIKEDKSITPKLLISCFISITMIFKFSFIYNIRRLFELLKYEKDSSVILYIK